MFGQLLNAFFKFDFDSVSVWKCRPHSVCWPRANHLLIMSPRRRGHHAVYGEKCVT